MPVQDHLQGTVSVPANLLAHTNFLFFPPHLSLSALPWQDWHTAHQNSRASEVQPSELGGQQGALVRRAVVPAAIGWSGSPELPSPRGSFTPSEDC